MALGMTPLPLFKWSLFNNSTNQIQSRLPLKLLAKILKTVCKYKQCKTLFYTKLCGLFCCSNVPNSVFFHQHIMLSDGNLLLLLKKIA